MTIKAMSTKRILACSALIFALGAVSAAQGPGPQKNQKAEAKAAPRDDSAQQRKVIQEAMANKLKSTHDVVTALSVEDFALLADSAQRLKQIGQNVLFKVSPNLTYVKYSAEFATLADELARRAQEKDINGATLSYIRLTINCVECHKFCRDSRIFGAVR